MSEIPPIVSAGTKRSRLSRLLRPKVAIPVSLVVLILLSPLIIRGWHLRGVPDVPEPFDPEPLLSLKIPDEDNAFTYYREAATLFVEPSEHVIDLRDGGTTEVPLGINTEGWHLADDEVRQFLRDNEAALAAWKRGTEQEQSLLHPIQELHVYDPENETLFEQMHSIHEAVLLLGKKLEAEGNHVAAWDWYRASFRGSLHLLADSIWDDYDVGLVCFSDITLRIATWAGEPGIPGEVFRRAVEELQRDWSFTPSKSTILQRHYLYTNRFIAALENGEFDWDEIGLDDLEFVSLELPVNSFTLFVMGEPSITKRLLRYEFKNQLRFCELPPCRRPKLLTDTVFYETTDPEDLTLAELEVAYNSSSILEEPVGIDQLLSDLDRNELRYRKLLVTLAGQAFYREHRRFPQMLDELVPNYLDHIPLDIYDNHPLKYRYHRDGPIVYSMNDDLSDEGGNLWREVSPESLQIESLFGDEADIFFQMRIPQIKPLRAEKPPIPESE